MDGMLTLKIDVTKIDKSRLFKGKKGTYLDLVVFVNPHEGQYGDFGMVKQDLGKEARERGEKGPILGNVRFVKDNAAEAEPAPEQQKLEIEEDPDDEIPF